MTEHHSNHFDAALLFWEEEQCYYDFQDYETGRLNDDTLFKLIELLEASIWFDPFNKHYYQVQEMYEPDYVNNFWKKVELGEVKKYENWIES